jgi:hypothetical protein
LFNPRDWSPSDEPIGEYSSGNCFSPDHRERTNSIKRGLVP